MCKLIEKFFYKTKAVLLGRGDVGQMHQKFYFDCRDLKF